MKKLVSILLALAMIFAMTTTAFAEEITTLTVADGRTFTGYQLLYLTTSEKTGDQHTTHEGAHTDACYNYAYTVNPKYLPDLQDEVFANGGNYLWTESGKPANSDGITEDQILKYLSNQKTETTDTVRQVAENIYKRIKDMDPDTEELKATTTIAQGYWMFVDVTGLEGENAANSLVVLDTKGQSELTITPKTALPTVEKKVKDIEDSEDANITDNAWHDTADHDIGDSIPFKLTGTLPSNAQYYSSYKMVFHDTLSVGLTCDAGSVKVYMYETKHKADVDTDMNDYAQDVTEKFLPTVTTADDGTTLTVGCDNVFAIDGVTKDTAFVVYYTATLNDKAVIGAVGNPNEVYLEFSNNPYGDTTGKTETDEVSVFTYQLNINKIDGFNAPLVGAGFTLYKKDSGGNYVAIGEELKGDTMTTFIWTGLDDGDYKLQETTVPSGYNGMDEILFSISAEHSETDGEPQLLSLDGGLMGTGTVETGAITKDIVNNTGTVLPETGAKGTAMLITMGAMLVTVAAVFMVTRKKMSIYED